MKAKIEQCTAVRKGKLIPVGENKRFVRFESKVRLTLDEVLVDGCVFPPEQKPRRCDFLVIVDNEYYFIECKGSKVLSGLEQLEITVKALKGLGFKQCHALLVCSKVPGTVRQGIQNAKVKFRDKLKAKLRVESQPIIVKL